MKRIVTDYMQNNIDGHWDKVKLLLCDDGSEVWAIVECGLDINRAEPDEEDIKRMADLTQLTQKRKHITKKLIIYLETPKSNKFAYAITCPYCYHSWGSNTKDNLCPKCNGVFDDEFTPKLLKLPKSVVKLVQPKGETR